MVYRSTIERTKEMKDKYIEVGLYKLQDMLMKLHDHDPNMKIVVQTESSEALGRYTTYKLNGNELFYTREYGKETTAHVTKFFLDLVRGQ